MEKCKDCWWLSDDKTGICCNWDSEYYKTCVNMDNTCRFFSRKDGKDRPDPYDWLPPYGREEDGK